MALHVTPVQHTTPPIPEPQETEFIQFRGNDVGWPKHALPLWITIHSDLEPWRPLIEEEAAAWNKRIGATVFRIVRRSLSADGDGAVVPFRPVWDQNPHTRLFFSAESEILASPIYLPHINRLRNLVVRRRVVAHELGHVLGLAHDIDDPFSLMYPTALPIQWRVTANDISALKKKYGGPRRRNRRDPEPDDIGGVGVGTSTEAFTHTKPFSSLDDSSCSNAGMLWMQAK